jgi:hypothetical protein
MIGGNIKATIQEKTTAKNEIGEKVTTWIPLETHLKGFLDYLSGEGNYSTYNSKLSDSTHIFVCDYVDFNFDIRKHNLLINGKVYDITFIDNPMELNKHLEIFLKHNEAYDGNSIQK